MLGASPARLHGVDIIEERVAKALQVLPTSQILCAPGDDLPYPADRFDIVLQYTVLSSVLDTTTRHRVAREMVRVLKPDGIILSYDFWLNPTNRQTIGLRKREVRSLFPGSTIDFHRLTLAPPIARRIIGAPWDIFMLLERLALLNSHYLSVIVPDR